MNDEQAIKDVAQGAGDFVAKLNSEILFPIIALLSALALLLFIYGAVVYIFTANEIERAKGKSHIIYGILGLLIMASAWGILNLVAGTFGLDDKLECANDPTMPGCESEFLINTTP